VPARAVALKAALKTNANNSHLMILIISPF